MGGQGEMKMCIFQKGECEGVATNVYSRKNVRKTKKKGLQISKIRVRELFTCREGISTLHACHQGQWPLIKCAQHDFKTIYFPFYIFYFLGSTRVLPLLLHILRCDEAFRPMNFFSLKVYVKLIYVFLKD